MAVTDLNRPRTKHCRRQVLAVSLRPSLTLTSWKVGPVTSAQNESQALGDLAARQLANATKTVPQLSTITPRFLLHLLSWVPVEAGIYRVNRVVDPDRVAIHSEEGAGTEEPLPETYVDYETNPREYTLRSISTLLDVHTRVSDLYSSPHDQVAQQLRLTIETIKERQEFELVNNPEYGLLSQVTPEQTIQTLRGTPTPDDLDSLITKVWKTPAFFLTNPLGVAAFGREATRRACRRQSSACSAPSSSPGAASRSCPRTRSPSKTARPNSSWCAPVRSARVLSACSSRGWSASRLPACRCGSPASTGRRSRPTW